MSARYKSRLPHQDRVHIKGSLCVYCGMLATTQEHFPPASYSRRGLVLPACQECNSLAGTAYPTDFPARCEYVKDRIRKKNQKALRFPVWHEDDLDEMGKQFKREIGAWQERRRIAHSRIAWNAESYLACIGLVSFSALMNTVSRIITKNDDE